MLFPGSNFFEQVVGSFWIFGNDLLVSLGERPFFSQDTLGDAHVTDVVQVR